MTKERESPNDYLIEIRIIRYVLAIARHQSFTRAAAALHVSQPSLSQQIIRLERALGEALFVRQHDGATPTSVGEAFIERAEALMVVHDDLVREMEDHRERRTAILTVGAPSITGGHLLPPWLAQYHRKHSHVQVRLIEESPDRLELLTERGVTDLSILALPIRSAKLETRPILTEEILLALPARPTSWMPSACSAWYQTEPWDAPIVSLALLAMVPFILLKPSYGFRETVLGLCAAAGFQPQIVFETANIETAQSLAAHGHGVTLVPEMVRDGRDGGPRYLHLEDSPTRTLVLARRHDRYLSYAAREFMAMWPDHAAPNAKPP